MCTSTTVSVCERRNGSVRTPPVTVFTHPLGLVEKGAEGPVAQLRVSLDGDVM